VEGFANGATLSNRITAVLGENESRSCLIRLPQADAGEERERVVGPAREDSLALVFGPVRKDLLRNGRHVDLRLAPLLAVGFAVGVFAGGRWAQAISDLVLRRVFAVTLVVIATRMWFER
jgi:hypothetical protein